MSQQAPLWKDILGAVRRQWWIVAVTTVVATGVGFAASSTAQPSSTATGTIALNAVSLGRYAPLMTGDRLLEALKSGDFYDYAAARTGKTAQELKSETAISAANKAIDRLTVRVTGRDGKRTQEIAASYCDAVIAYATERGLKQEVARREQLVEAAKTSLELAEKQKSRVLAGSNDPLALVEIEGRIMEFRDVVITTGAELESLEDAYRVDGGIKVTQQSTGAKLERTLVGSVLAGFFLGLAVAAAREYLLRRPAGA